MLHVTLDIDFRFSREDFPTQLSEAFITLSRHRVFIPTSNVTAGSGCFMDSNMIQVSKEGHFTVLKVDWAHEMDTPE